MPSQRSKPGRKPERTYYEALRTRIEDTFTKKYASKLMAWQFEVTASGRFSDDLKGRIGRDRDIIFSFLKGRGKSPPDITGYVAFKEDQYNDGFVIAEFKRDALELRDIYQLKRYVDLFDARYAFLVSLERIPEEIKRLSQAVYNLLILPSGYNKLTLVTYDEGIGEFTHWFPENPLTLNP